MKKQLDHYLLPHPLLGKITLREMLFFSAYHIQHHTKFWKIARDLNDHKNEKPLQVFAEAFTLDV